MGCPCEELAGKDIALGQVCIGYLWIFRDLAAKELQMLAGNAIRRQMKKGQFVFYQGDDSMETFLLKSGRVKLTKILENGMEIILDIGKSGDFIDENMLSEELEYPVNAV